MPQILTDDSKRIMEYLHPFVDKYYDKVIVIVQKANPNTAYECELIIKDAVRFIFKRSYIIQDIAFIEGNEIDDLLAIISVYFRDKILEELKLMPLWMKEAIETKRNIRFVRHPLIEGNK